MVTPPPYSDSWWWSGCEALPSLMRIAMSTILSPPTSKKRHPDNLTCWWDVHKEYDTTAHPFEVQYVGSHQCLRACQDESFLYSSCPGLLQVSRVQTGGTSPKETTPLRTPSRLIPRHTIWHTNSQKSELSQLKCAYTLQALLPFHFIPFHFMFHKFMYAITSSVEAY